jgi:hypothetical protein
MTAARRPTQTRRASVADARAYLAKASEFLRAAEDALALANRVAATGNAVHAGIAAADAITAARAATVWKGEHSQAPAHLEKAAGSDGKKSSSPSSSARSDEEPRGIRPRSNHRFRSQISGNGRHPDRQDRRAGRGPTRALSFRISRAISSLLGRYSIPTFIPTHPAKGLDRVSRRSEYDEVSGQQVTRRTDREEHPDLRGHQPDPAGRDLEEAARVAARAAPASAPATETGHAAGHPDRSG